MTITSMAECSEMIGYSGGRPGGQCKKILGKWGEIFGEMGKPGRWQHARHAKEAMVWYALFPRLWED